MSADCGRDNLIGRALDVLQYAENARAPFTRFELAEALEINPRTALRWLNALTAREKVREVVLGRSHFPQLWERVPPLEGLRKRAETHGLGVISLFSRSPKVDERWLEINVDNPLDQSQFDRLKELIQEFEQEWPTFPSLESGE